MDERPRSLAPSPRHPMPPPAAPAPVVSGLVACRPRRPDGGPPWRARDSATGHELLLRPWPAGGSAGLIADLPEHPHLHAARVLYDTAGTAWLASRVAPHGGLDRFVGRRGPLSPGEAATVALGVGRALAVLHAAGRVHGSVRVATVLLVAGVRPALDVRPMALPPAPDAGVAEDVRALGALVTDLLGGPAFVPTELRMPLSAAADPDPGLRPGAADFSRQVVAAVPPQALRPVGEGPGARTSGSALANDRPDRPARVRSRARTHMGSPVRAGARALLSPASAAVAALALAVLAGTAWARFSESPPTGVPRALDRSVSSVPGPAPATAAAAAAAEDLTTSAMPSAGPAPAWTEVLRDLDLRRAAAFANADEGVLASVDAAGSPALAADLAVVGALAAAHLQARGYRLSILDVRPVRVAAGAAVLSVRDVRRAYQLVADGSSVVAYRPERAAARWIVELVRMGGRWLVSAVRPG